MKCGSVWDLRLTDPPLAAVELPAAGHPLRRGLQRRGVRAVAGLRQAPGACAQSHATCDAAAHGAMPMCRFLYYDKRLTQASAVAPGGICWCEEQGALGHLGSLNCGLKCGNTLTDMLQAGKPRQILPLLRLAAQQPDGQHAQAVVHLHQYSQHADPGIELCLCSNASGAMARSGHLLMWESCCMQLAAAVLAMCTEWILFV